MKGRVDSTGRFFDENGALYDQRLSQLELRIDRAAAKKKLSKTGSLEGSHMNIVQEMICSNCDVEKKKAEELSSKLNELNDRIVRNTPFLERGKLVFELFELL